MADDQNQGPPQPSELPALPEPFQFNYQLLEQWLAIPAHETVQAPLTRQDIDHLIFALSRSAEAQSALEAVLTHWSNGRVQEANTKLLDFRRLNLEFLNNTRQFFSGLMIAALRARTHVKG
jgi:hypothetical protein